LPADAEPIISPYRYALRKTFGEKVLRELLPEKSVMFRSHGLRGYPTSAPRHEPYWQVKIQRGKDLVVPDGADYYQTTDMISLARFMIVAGERGLSGAYNVAYTPQRFREFINGIVAELKSNVTLHWVPQQFLLGHDVQLIRTTPAGRYRFDVTKALNDGLINRPKSELLADQLRGYWDRNLNGDFEFGQPETATISDQREQEIIELWAATKSASILSGS
jgi:hypothetical protein